MPRVHIMFSVPDARRLSLTPVNKPGQRRPAPSSAPCATALVLFLPPDEPKEASASIAGTTG